RTTDPESPWLRLSADDNTRTFIPPTTTKMAIERTASQMSTSTSVKPSSPAPEVPMAGLRRPCARAARTSFSPSARPAAFQGPRRVRSQAHRGGRLHQIARPTRPYREPTRTAHSLIPLATPNDIARISSGLYPYVTTSLRSKPTYQAIKATEAS